MKKILVRTAAAAAALGLLAAMAYGWVFVAVAGRVKAEITVFIGQGLGLPPNAADAVGWAIAFLTAGTVLRLAWRFSTGRFGFKDAAVVGACIAAMAAGYRVATADWLFDDRGRAIVFACPPVAAGKPPRFQYEPADRLLGSNCPPVTRKTAPILLAIRDGVLPTEIVVRTLAEFDTLVLSDSRSGLPLIHTGASYAGRLPKLYRGIGYDPLKPGALLSAISAESVIEIRTLLADSDRVREEASRAENEARERDARADAKRLAEEERRQKDAEEREKAMKLELAIQQERARQAEAQARASQEQRQQRDAEARLAETQAQEAARQRERQMQNVHHRPVSPAPEPMRVATHCHTPVAICQFMQPIWTQAGSYCECWLPHGRFAGQAF